MTTQSFTSLRKIIQHFRGSWEKEGKLTPQNIYWTNSSLGHLVFFYAGLVDELSDKHLTYPTFVEICQTFRHLKSLIQKDYVLSEKPEYWKEYSQLFDACEDFIKQKALALESASLL